MNLVEIAKVELDNMPLCGKQLHMLFACHGASLTVQNLPHHVSSELLEIAFFVFGQVERAIVIVNDQEGPQEKALLNSQGNQLLGRLWTDAVEAPSCKLHFLASPGPVTMMRDGTLRLTPPTTKSFGQAATVEGIGAIGGTLPAMNCATPGAEFTPKVGGERERDVIKM
uniref:Uncharacterized protein n=1 Tax=Molossus molossus TaxID=27622 RepID=A0A7J8HHM8_MOLMO|nr:hypothetical protein HJG59_011006 [Molossus molossus]